MENVTQNITQVMTQAEMNAFITETKIWLTIISLLVIVVGFAIAVYFIMYQRRFEAGRTPFYPEPKQFSEFLEGLQQYDIESKLKVLQGTTGAKCDVLLTMTREDCVISGMKVTDFDSKEMMKKDKGIG